MCALLSHRTKGHDFVTIIEVSMIAQELVYSMYCVCIMSKFVILNKQTFPCYHRERAWILRVGYKS